MLILNLIWMVPILGAEVVYENFDNYESPYETAELETIFSQFIPNDEPYILSSCLLNFLREKMQNSKDVPVYISPSSPMSRNAELALEQLLTTLTIYLVQGDMKSVMAHNSTPNAIIIANDLNAVTNITTDLRLICNAKCSFIVIITTTYNSETSFMNEADRWVAAFWYKHITNVAMVYNVENRFYMAKTRSFKANVTCRPSVSISMGVCDEGSWQNWYDFNKPLFMNYCIASVAFFRSEPYVISSNYSAGIPQGVEGDILDLVSEVLRINMKGYPIEWSNDTNYNVIVNRYLEYVDLVFGGLLWEPSQSVYYSTPYEMVPIVWFTPSSPNLSIRKLIVPFNVQVWIGIIVVFIIVAIKKMILPHEIPFLGVLSLFIGVPWYNHPKKVSGKIPFIFFVIYGYVLTQSYLASLAGQLVSNSATLQINTIDEVIHSGLEYGGTAQLNYLIQLMDDGLSDHDNTEIILKKNFKIYKHDEYVEKLNDLNKGKTSQVALAVMVNVSSERPNYNPATVHIVNEGLGHFPLAFAVAKSLPYLEKFDQLMLILREGGFIQRIAKQYAHNNMIIKKTERTVLMLSQIIPAFLLLVTGYTLATIVLLIEFFVASHAYVKKRINEAIIV